MERIAVREAVSGDAPVIAAFQLAMALETEQLMLDPEVVDKGVTAVFGRPELGCYYVAEKEGRSSALCSPPMSGATGATERYCGSSRCMCCHSTAVWGLSQVVWSSADEGRGGLRVAGDQVVCR